jgi:transposase
VAPCCAAQSFVFCHQKNEPTGSPSRPQTQHDMHNENIPGSEPFPNEPTHNMPLRQLSGRGLTLETGLAREFGSLLSAALRSAPPKADSIRTGWRAKTDKIDGETLVRSLLAYKRGEPRVCSMVKAPTPEEEDQRRLCRERKVLTAERVLHVNRIKGLLFCQGICGYEPLRRERLEELQTGDGRPLPTHLKAQVERELDRLELLLEQIKTVEGERDALLAAAKTAMPAPAAMLLDIKGIGPEFAAVLWSEGLCRYFDN